MSLSPYPKKELSLFDSTCLIVGIIIGAGIYQTAPDVAKGIGNGWGVLAIWACGGLLSLCGAMGYAELATAYPREGGDYVYLSRAYGRWAGFLFGWAQLAIVRPGDIAVMAFVFATYAQTLFDPLVGTALPLTRVFYAAGAIVVLTVINVMGTTQGKRTQNLLTIVKTIGLLAIVGSSFLSLPSRPAPTGVESLPWSLALILVLFTFGGWNEMAYVAAEIKNPKRNIVRALTIGTLAVTVLYLMLNAAFLYSLGYPGLSQSRTVAADTMTIAFPNLGGKLISLLICLSALGAVSGLIFTGARISYALGEEYRIFGFLGQWDAQRGTPARALWVQGAMAVVLILVLGSFLNAILYTAATVYTFYLATTLAILVLRRKEPRIERPYRVLGYPIIPIIFSAVCAFLIYSSICYKPHVAAISTLLLPIGLILYRYSRQQTKAQDKEAR
jgi:basic amino acid/polyamine antiporter, APA family